MKMLRRVAVLLLALMLFCPLVSAQTTGSHSISEQVLAVLNRYKDEKGILAMESDGGVKLQAVKLILRKEFGSEFANAATAFAIIFYKDASTECANKIVSEIGQITRSLREIDVSGQLKRGERARGYIRLSNNKSNVTDLIIHVHTPSPKLIYIKGSFDASGITAPK